MREKLARQLRKQFASSMKQEFPRFERLKGGIDDLLVFRWREEPFSFYVALQVTEGDQEHFTVEIAWARKNRYPYSAWGRRSEARPGETESRFRLAKFWTNDDPWWVLSKEIDPEKQINALLKGKPLRPEPIETVEKRIPTMVADSIGKIKEHAIPYFDRIAAQARKDHLPKRR